ncbi:hypothetical protein [Caulobacter sp. 17J80-11]|uniref:hypothetical protein n=1 Tax=Caulobacter sp. 17J80-11 TaxID=2763502 RepID=UPI001653D928|nr:hypothetical protein [Caulobacter sp. 17J80-11]MBC6983643.1 hypothetical protein [Caulobacter sp. 17J80-11]
MSQSADIAVSSWEDDIEKLSLPDLMRKYPIEAGAHRGMLFHRGRGLNPGWREFKRFLADMGPCPQVGYVLTFYDPNEISYGPGRVCWCDPAKPPKKFVPPADALRPDAMAQWTTVQGRQVAHTDVAKVLQIPMATFSSALNEGRTADEVVHQSTAADELINPNASWLPPDTERRNGFLQAYKAWHLRIRPAYSRAATPAFLFAYIAVPVLRDSRKLLTELGLWEPLSLKDTKARDAHPAWKRWCEFLPRAQTAVNEIDAYRSYSLFTELEDLADRITKAELRFRHGPKQPPMRKAA